jgi:diguanylate cyclase (GGDEF)-like protein
MDPLVFLISNALGLGVGLLSVRASRSLRARGSRLGPAWRLVGYAQLLTVVGNVVWFVYNAVTRRDNFPSPADILFMIVYALFFIAAMMIPSKKVGRYDALKAGIDIIVVGLAAMLVYWNFILGPLVRSLVGKPALEVGLAMVYPVADLALFWVVVVVIHRISQLPGYSAVWLLVFALIANIAIDTVMSYQSLFHPNTNATWVMAANVLSFALMGAGAIRMDRQARDPNWSLPERVFEISADDTHLPRLYALTGYLPYFWVGCAYLVLVFFDRTVLPMSLFQLTLSVGAIFLLFLTRQVVTFRENKALYAKLQASHQEARIQAETLRLINQEMKMEITERLRAEERLSYDALHDALTGLPNRVLLLDRIDQAYRKGQRMRDQKFALLFLDLDRFKVINDSLGHGSGDQLLVAVAKILSHTMRGMDTVARLGGDEFVILLEGVSSQEDVLLTADRLQMELAKPIQLDVTPVYVSASIGIVTATEGYESSEALLRDADLAMYQAKAQGKARYVIFDSDMRTLAISRLEMENDLRRALERNEFLLYYQPVVSLVDQRLVGFEALCRWQHPLRGLLTSAEFIPIAEETGLILGLGKWVLAEACRQAAHWSRTFARTEPLKINVNLSVRQLNQPDFVSMVTQALQNAGLPAGCLVLEVTETICMENLDMVTGVFEALKTLGVEIQIDDFGTGYSSLRYLQRLPVHTIKIDKSFIQPISMGGVSLDMVRGILSMASEIGITSVAEGIETEHQLEELEKLQCQFGQGYFLAYPMDQDAAETWIRGQKIGVGA